MGTEYAVRTVSKPFSSTARQCPRITLPYLLVPPSKASYSNPRIPGGICSIHENEISGRRAKGAFERICGIRSRHPMSHCTVVTSRRDATSRLDKQPFCSHRPRSRVSARDFQRFSLISLPSLRIERQSSGNESGVSVSLELVSLVSFAILRSTRLLLPCHERCFAGKELSANDGFADGQVGCVSVNESGQPEFDYVAPRRLYESRRR